MAYAGTTSTSPNPPFLVAQGIAYASSNVTGSTLARYGQPREWRYVSTHTQAEVAAANFFTDGKDLGLAVGDSVLVVGTTTYVISQHAVRTVGSTTTQLSAGLLISSAS